MNLDTSPLINWNAEAGLPDFAMIDETGFEPAFDAAMEAHKAEIEAIAAEKAEANIENTLAALELSGEYLSRISSIFWARAGADTNEAIQSIERIVAPKISAHYSWLGSHEALFARIDALYQKRETLDLDTETLRVLEHTHSGFVRSGALLSLADKAKLSEFNGRLATLGANFGQNVLKDESTFALILTADDVAGCPEFLIEAMASAAGDRGHEGSYAVTLSRSLAEPFLSFSPRRDLREKLFNAFVARGENGGDTDNTAIIAEILSLRAQKAKLLGFETFADYKLERTMAKTPARVLGLLEPVWQAALTKAAAEEADLNALAIENDGLNGGIAPWDWRYYAEKVRTKRFDFDESALKPYLTLDNMIAAAFDVANRLFGLTFEPVQDAKAWHADARVWRVLAADGTEQGLFIGDYFARSSKRSGAWMSALRSQHGLEQNGKKGQTPIIYNVCNFAKPAKGQPALLSFDEARTLFHELGHGMHGMLSSVIWPSVSGTSVYRDFVELPSQLYEHWLGTTEILSKHARHYKTGDAMPKALMDKLKAASRFNAGFNAVEFSASALMDMAYHASGDVPADPMAFEKAQLLKIHMPDAIAMRHRSPHFQHVFSGDGYSAGYYSYLWSEVLDADAFAAFEETGDPFNIELAQKLKTHIYAAGGSQDPEALYTAFRGRMPAPDAMMKKRGLV